VNKTMKELGLKADNETRSKVVTAFRKLRSKGFIARANYLCCQTCAGHAIGEELDKQIALGKKMNGYVFWHRQDEDSYWRTGVLFLAYGGAGETSTEKAGRTVVETLEACGLKVEWNGDIGQRIRVIVQDEEEEEELK